MAENKKSKISFTDEQLSAINERSKTLLVSAAAGSGKTATLTERIIRSLTDRERAINIESVLVVTFTNAAAAELRLKLSRALEKAVEENPDDEHLRHQLYMLPSAKIRTIDSFCNDILRSSADRVGLGDGYRIADGAECDILAISIIDGLIYEIYSGALPEVATPEELEELSDCLTDSKRAEEFSELLRYVYAKCEPYETGVDVLLPMIEYYSTEKFLGVEKTKHGAYLISLCKRCAEHYAKIASKYEKILSSGSELSILYSEMAGCDKLSFERLLSYDDYKSLKDAVVSFAFTDKPSKRGADKSADMLDYSDLRDMMRDDIKELKSYFLYTEQEWCKTLEGLHRLLSVLYRVEKKFDELFLAEKKRRGALSYADIERLCYECLVKNGERTDIAINLERQLEAIYIDEYQDVNSLQNSIFSAISRKNNRFMVGDIKQSIYGFRSARPEIFAEMKASFPPLSTSECDTGSIFMSKNFRCDRGIVDFVNAVFDKTFSLIGESIGYAAGDRLEYAKTAPESEPEYRKPEICLVDKDSPLGEYEVVAEKISELLRCGTLNNGEPIRAEDIAIILRSAGERATLYSEALAKRGIPTQISGAKKFFLSSEVLLTLCLLNVIDNPRRDIYLMGLLSSPLYSFDADDLYLIQHGGSHSSLYEALVSYTEANSDFEKGKKFLTELDYYRTIAEGIKVDTLISKLYHETGLLSLAAHSGGTDNLNLLYDYARTFEGGSYRGLYSFIAFINGIIDKKTAFDDKREVGEENAVKIITCHSSKGLEYPVVFLAGTSSPFNEDDVRGRLVFSEQLGISFRLRTPLGLALVNSPVHDMVCHGLLVSLREEELRILYVALTRARERLFITGKNSLNSREKYLNRTRLIRENLSPYWMRERKNYLEIMLVSSGIEPVSVEDFLPDYAGAVPEIEEFATSGCEAEFELGATPCDENLEKTLTERFTYKYPDRYMTVLPEKLSVSKMSPDVLDLPDAEFVVDFTAADGDADDLSYGTQSERDELVFADKNLPYDAFSRFKEESADIALGNGGGIYGSKAFLQGEAAENSDTPPDASLDEARTLPKFKTGRSSEESAKRGIATHMFLQFCDLENLAVSGAKAELERLTSLGFLSEKDSARVRLYEIEAFRNSQLFFEMRRAKKLYRELRFNVRLPAYLFTENAEMKEAYKDKHVLVQGVIDCIVEREDGSLALYDYKTDRLTKEERETRRLAEKKLCDKHTRQLSYYALSVREMFGKAPDRVALYSLPLGDTVDIKTEDFTGRNY